MSQEITTVNGAAQSENPTLFCVGEVTTVADIEIRWSNGDTDTHQNIDVGRHLFVQQ